MGLRVRDGFERMRGSFEIGEERCLESERIFRSERVCRGERKELEEEEDRSR